MTLYRVSLPCAVFGLVARDGTIVRAAPLARWAVGRPVGAVLGHYLRRYPGAEWQALVRDGVKSRKGRP